jgi:hypothetical protein
MISDIEPLYQEYAMDSRLYTASDKFLGSAHLSGDVTLTVADVTLEDMRDGKSKMCLHWVNPDRLPFLLNKTNIKRLQKLFGDDTDTWLGKDVTLYNDPDVEFMGEVVGGLRVRTAEKKA